MLDTIIGTRKKTVSINVDANDLPLTANIKRLFLLEEFVASVTSQYLTLIKSGNRVEENIVLVDDRHYTQNVNDIDDN